jgi:hypothetical protein
VPYIAPDEREYYDNVLNQLSSIGNKGDLEYCIYKLLVKYMSNREFRYSPLHDAVYACIHAGEEFKRNFLDKRESQAKETNGDIL